MAIMIRQKYYEKVLSKENDNNEAKFGLATTLYKQDKKEIASSYFQSVSKALKIKN